MSRKLLITASTYSHIEHFHLPYIRKFHELGWEVHVACGGKETEIPFADKVVSLSLKKSFTSLSNFKACAQLHSLMSENEYSLVIAHTSLAAFFTRLAELGIKPHPKTIHVVHGYLFDDRTPKLKAAVLKAAELFVAPQTDFVLTMNAYDNRWAKAHRAGKDVRSIPGMGVDEKKLVPTNGYDFGFSEDDFVLVYAAEFSERKNQAVLIRTMAQLPERVKLLLPGEGALLESCKSLAKELSVSDRVVFPGYVHDVAGILAQADVAASCSRSEGLPFNVMEAMLMGLPVVASKVKGHTDLVEDGVTGFLCEYGDESAFANAIGKLLDDMQLAEQMGARGKEKAQAYTLDTVFSQVMDQYLS